MKKTKYATLDEAVELEISYINDELDYDEKLTKKQIKEATKRFLNGNYIGECINQEIINIIDEIKEEGKNNETL